MKKLKHLISNIRANGCSHLLQNSDIRQVVYTNMIWMVTYAHFIIFSVLYFLLVPVPVKPFLLITAAVHVLFINCFLLIKYKYTQAGKHLLIISTYLMLAVVDHMDGRQTMAFLYFFAFLPAAINIFSLRKQWPIIAVYSLFPGAYSLFTKLTSYTHPVIKQYDAAALQTITAIHISLVTSLFILFAAYLVLNNVAKQHRLFVKSLGLQTTLDNAESAIWSIDNHYGLLAANSKYISSIEKEFGVTGLKTGVNIKQHPIWEKLPAALKKQYSTVLSGKEILHEIQLNEQVFEIKAVPITGPNGKIMGATFGSRNITAKRKAEKAIIGAKLAAEEASLAKARFLSNMSHELRTPLNGIIGITRIMQDEKYLPEQEPNLRTLQDLSEHTLQLINNILDFAKIEAGKATLENNRFNLDRFIEKINSIFAGTAQLKKIKFIVEKLGDTDIFLKGDEVRLSQVLINLIGNAFKFTEKGSVSFKVAVLNNGAAPGTQCIRFAVADTGIGIREESAGKIFESFGQADTQTTRLFGGTGLGLSIADKIAQLMNSRIQLRSEYGRGSEFWFDVTLQESSFIPEAIQNKNIQNIKALLHLHVLVAEDNKVNQLVASRILQKWETEVTIACNGQEAVDCFTKNRFDVVLMDLDMPVMDGYESAAIIKEKYPEVPVIALTAASFDDMHNYLRNKGFSEVVQKPFVPNDLYSKIQAVLKKAG
ncbi:MAG: ATP-binding protein [Ferruginibacter sp.]